MALIKSISGIRGTIGGIAGNGLTPPDIIKFTAAYGQWVIANSGKKTIVMWKGNKCADCFHKILEHMIRPFF